MGWIYCGEGCYINLANVTSIRRSNDRLNQTPGMFEVFTVNGGCIHVMWNSVHPEYYEELEKFLTEQTAH